MERTNAYSVVIASLKDHQIAFTIHAHEAIRTVSDAEEKLLFPKTSFLKTIVFKIKHSSWILAALRGEDSVDYRKLAAAFGVKRDDIIRPSAEEIEASLGYEIGGVCPIPVQPDMEVVVDSNALKMEQVYCGSGRNDRTLEIKLQDLLRLSQARVLPLAREQA
ncbi:MAG TPA: YbaK/EbsC family protein [Ktedonosporobacter sp.]|jgi:Cys-tRNA(Pro)/Cys-tRNA(Cys) deacylase|nr:YbaK/EbsC family protein [Ktedonosporobacter sp.]